MGLTATERHEGRTCRRNRANGSGSVLRVIRSRVAFREYSWTDAGKISAARHGVTEREVVEALYSPQRIENRIGTLLLAVAGLLKPRA